MITSLVFDQNSAGKIIWKTQVEYIEMFHTSHDYLLVLILA